MNYHIIPVTSLAQNCTLVWCDETKKAALIDPGGNVDLLIDEIQKRGLELESLLLTHGHLDHVGASGDLVKRFATPIIGPHIDDKYWIEGLPQQCKMFGFPPLTEFTPDRWLNDGDTVKVGNVVLEVLHCPGHTPGHVVFYHRDSQWMQVGDVLFSGSIGRTDFPGGNYASLISSIKNKLFPLGEEVEFVPGHGPMSTLGEEKHNNPFLS